MSRSKDRGWIFSAGGRNVWSIIFVLDNIPLATRAYMSTLHNFSKIPTHYYNDNLLLANKTSPDSAFTNKN